MIIGITGGISSGKSFFSNYLKEKGFFVICADEISKKITEKNQKGYFEIIKNFDNILDENQNVNRKELGNIIFSDFSKRKLLNEILHPIIKEEIKKQINIGKKTYTNVFVDVPLLYEASFDDLCDYVVVVYCEKETQIKRLMIRDSITREEALKKINSQMNLEEKVKLGNYVINNSLSKEKTLIEFEKFLKEVA